MKKKIIICIMVAVLVVSMAVVTMAVAQPDMPELSEKDQLWLGEFFGIIEEKLEEEGKTYDDIYEEWVAEYEEELANAKTDEDRAKIQVRLDNLKENRKTIEDYYKYYRQNKWKNFWKGLWD